MFLPQVFFSWNFFFAARKRNVPKKLLEGEKNVTTLKKVSWHQETFL